MIAIAVAVVQVIVILIHRRRTEATGPRTTPWAYMAACLAACVVGWLVIGRPAIEWGDLFLTLVFGVFMGSETARAVKELFGRAWAAWTTAAVCGAASATWLLQNPLPFT